jgi:hypothetical protein
MRNTLLFKTLRFVICSSLVCLSPLIFAETPEAGGGSQSGNYTALLVQANTVLAQAADLETNPGMALKEKALLNEARLLVLRVPLDQALYHGHRKKAMLAIKAAISEIEGEDPAPKPASDYIRTAEGELRSAVAAASKAASEL